MAAIASAKTYTPTRFSTYWSTPACTASPADVGTVGTRGMELRSPTPAPPTVDATGPSAAMTSRYFPKIGPAVVNSPAMTVSSWPGCRIRRRARSSHAGSLRGGLGRAAGGFTVGRGGGPALGGVGPRPGGVGPRGGGVGPRGGGGGGPPGGRGGPPGGRGGGGAPPGGRPGPPGPRGGPPRGAGGPPRARR